MKPIEPGHSFVKTFAKRIARDAKLLKQYQARLEIFMAGQRGVPINDHALSGNLAGKRAFSITGDIRVIYVELEDKIIFLDIGTHNQIY